MEDREATRFCWFIYPLCLFSVWEPSVVFYFGWSWRAEGAARDGLLCPVLFFLFWLFLVLTINRICIFCVCGLYGFGLFVVGYLLVGCVFFMGLYISLLAIFFRYFFGLTLIMIIYVAPCFIAFIYLFLQGGACRDVYLFSIFIIIVLSSWGDTILATVIVLPKPRFFLCIAIVGPQSAGVLSPCALAYSCLVFGWIFASAMKEIRAIIAFTIVCLLLLFWSSWLLLFLVILVIIILSLPWIIIGFIITD